MSIIACYILHYHPLFFLIIVLSVFLFNHSLFVSSSTIYQVLGFDSKIQDVRTIYYVSKYALMLPACLKYIVLSVPFSLHNSVGEAA